MWKQKWIQKNSIQLLPKTNTSDRYDLYAFVGIFATA